MNRDIEVPYQGTLDLVPDIVKGMGLRPNVVLKTLGNPPLVSLENYYLKIRNLYFGSHGLAAKMSEFTDKYMGEKGFFSRTTSQIT
jgi:hypothetical protein